MRASCMVTRRASIIVLPLYICEVSVHYFCTKILKASCKETYISSALGGHAHLGPFLGHALFSSCFFSSTRSSGNNICFFLGHTLFCAFAAQRARMIHEMVERAPDERSAMDLHRHADSRDRSPECTGVVILVPVERRKCFRSGRRTWRHFPGS